jgi:hypothetical protein
LSDMAEEQYDLLGQRVQLGPPPVRPIEPAAEPTWERLSPPGQPRCMHCQLNRRKKRADRVLKASWRRIGVDGSLLDLCHGHRALKLDQDGAADGRAA